MENIYKTKLTREQLQTIEIFMDYSEGYISEFVTWNDIKPVVDRLLSFAPEYGEIMQYWQITIDINLDILVEKILGGIAFIISNAPKGAFLGKCNRSACDSKHRANWFNHSTLMFYCPSCADVLNNANRKDAFGLFGHELCTFGLYNDNK